MNTISNTYVLSDILGEPQPRDAILMRLRKNPSLFSIFERFRAPDQENLLRFLSGEKSLQILYDPFFKYVMDPETHPERLENLLSALLDEDVRIKRVLPREGIQLVDNGSFVIMDILSELSDGRIINVEMQKIGYLFPAERTTCYASDIVMRQYNRVRSQRKEQFTYKDIKDTHVIILMENSSSEFQSAPDHYIHKRVTSYSSGITLPEIVHITYVSLDSFRKAEHNINTELDAWLTFLSRDDAESIIPLVEQYPMFLTCYRDIATFRKKPEELIYMFSEALYILDRNTERLMVDELRAEVEDRDKTISQLSQEMDSISQEKRELMAQLTAYKERYGDLTKK